CRVHRFMKGEIHVYGVVLTGPDHPLHLGAKAVLTGLVPSAGVPVVLERRWTKSRWHALARQKPRPDGSYAFVMRIHGPSLLRARVGARLSPPVRVHVAPKVTVARSGATVVVTTDPARPGAPVALQVYERERFAFVSQLRATLDGEGKANLTVPAGAARR
ncbi:MAG: hypothetical protein WCP30_06415, partial [Mycobacteriaceae bacterium]